MGPTTGCSGLGIDKVQATLRKCPAPDVVGGDAGGSLRETEAYERHVRDFTDRAKSMLTAERLRQICESYQREKGFFGERELLAILRRPSSVVIVWKQRFTKVPGQYLAEMVLVERDGRALVDHVAVL